MLQRNLRNRGDLFAENAENAETAQNDFETIQAEVSEWLEKIYFEAGGF